MLWERGWWNDGDDIDAIIMTYLNPPEVVLRYRLTGNDRDSEISLYERERVEMLERTDPELIQHMQSVRARREREAQALRDEEERARCEASAAAEAANLEEQKERELAERLARQKIIRIDDWLH